MHKLRGPSSILLISHNACSDNMAKVFGACFVGYRTNCHLSGRYVAKWVWHRCAYVKLSTKGGIAPFWRAANLSKKYRATWGIAAIAISHGMGPLSAQRTGHTFLKSLNELVMFNRRWFPKEFLLKMPRLQTCAESHLVCWIPPCRAPLLPGRITAGHQISKSNALFVTYFLLLRSQACHSACLSWQWVPVWEWSN